MTFAYEFRKIIFNKISIGVFLICLCINAYVAMERTVKSEGNKEAGYISARKEAYKDFEGPITEDKIKRITDTYNVLNQKFITKSFDKTFNDNLYTGYEALEYQLYSELYKKVDYETGYSQKIENVREKAKKNVYFYRKEGVEDVVDYNTRIYGTYTDRGLDNFYRTNQWKYYFQYSFSNLMIILSLIIFLSGIFSYEREVHMSELIVTSRHGKRKTFIVKIMVAIFMAILITIIFSLEDLLIFTLKCNLKGFAEPLYSIEEMAYTAYDISIIQYIFIMIGIRIVGIIAIVFIVVLASSAMNNTLGGIVASIIAILPFVMINEEQVLFNPIALLQITGYVSTMVLDKIFGITMLYIESNLISCGVLIVLIGIICYLIENCSNAVIRKERI